MGRVDNYRGNYMYQRGKRKTKKILRLNWYLAIFTSVITFLDLFPAFCFELEEDPLGFFDTGSSKTSSSSVPPASNLHLKKKKKTTVTV